MRPLINLDKCDGCGLCVAVCGSNILKMVDKNLVIVDGDGCDWCALCEAVCISGAIVCPLEIVLNS